MGGMGISDAQSQSDGSANYLQPDDDQGDARMPWTAKQFKARHNKQATPSQAKKAASQATAMVAAGVPDRIAIPTANKTIQRMKRTGTISNRAADRDRGSRYAGHDQQPIDASSR